MKRLYIQGDAQCVFTKYGISSCCLKYLYPGYDNDSYTTTRHCHSDFELHIITNGRQVYDLSGERVTVKTGSLLIIPPGIFHRVVDFSENTKKITLYFKYDYRTNPLLFSKFNECILLQTPKSVAEGLEFITTEAEYSKTFSSFLIENRLLEIIISLFRAAGNMELPVQKENLYAPLILIMAKQYICDNIEYFPSVHDVAHYCSISVKQLYRLFLKYEGISAFSYIKNCRREKIKLLLADETLSLKVISEKLGFSSEYYLNIFFKKEYGMPPGAFRKLL